MIMDFPSKRALTEMFESDGYKRLIPARDKAFAEINICCASDLE